LFIIGISWAVYAIYQLGYLSSWDFSSWVWPHYFAFFSTVFGSGYVTYMIALFNIQSWHVSWKRKVEEHAFARDQRKIIRSEMKKRYGQTLNNDE